MPALRQRDQYPAAIRRIERANDHVEIDQAVDKPDSRMMTDQQALGDLFDAQRVCRPVPP